MKKRKKLIIWVSAIFILFIGISFFMYLRLKAFIAESFAQSGLAISSDKISAEQAAELEEKVKTLEAQKAPAGVTNPALTPPQVQQLEQKVESLQRRQEEQRDDRQAGPDEDAHALGCADRLLEPVGSSGAAGRRY